MDEAEKYQQRLQAIAEKRRLQEEQERVKREMEDERIRLQQLKRKSLRDQWLMEGPPASPDSTGPRSPLWGQQAEEIEQKIDSLQAKTDQLTEEVAKLTEDDGSVNDGQTHVNSAGVHILEDGRTEDSSSKGPVLQNGQGNGTTEVGAEEDVKETSVARVMAEVKGPNGEVPADVPAALQVETGQPSSTKEQGHIQGAEEEAAAMATSALLSQTAAEEAGAQGSKPVSNGPASKPGDGNGAVTLTFLGFSDPEKGEGDGVGVGVGVDDDGGAIMRAERVIIRDEEEEAEGEPKSQTEASEDPGAPQTSTGALENQEPEEATEDEAQPSAQAPAEGEKYTPAGLTEPEVTELAEPKAEAAEGENKGEDAELPSETQVVPEVIEATAAAVVAAAVVASADAETQPQPEPTEGAVVTSDVPVYTSAGQTAPTGEDEGLQPETSGLTREEEDLEAFEPVVGPEIVPVPSSPCRFEEVPLDESYNKAPKAPSGHTRQQAEHEPLLDSKTAPPADPAAPQRAEAGDAPKQKTCQCCSVM